MKTKPLPDPETINLPHIEKDAGYRSLQEQIAALEKRLDEARQRRLRAEALQRGVKPGRAPMARALDLLRGGTVSSASPAQEIVAADHEIYEILRPALGELGNQLFELRGNLSLTACRRVQALHRDALREVLSCIENLNVAVRVATGIRARVRAAGYDPLEPVLPSSAAPPAALVLGDRYDGKQTSMWLRFLEMHGTKID
jgi:cob(I)alamin adenosyltransferase